MVRLQAEPIRLEALFAEVRGDADGAVALFAGTVREHNAGRRVLRLEYHAWPEMALSEMETLERTARERHGASRVAIVHRTGVLQVGETSVAVAVASPHRAQALEACRFVIDALKARVPIWKKEFYEDGAEWIEGA